MRVCLCECVFVHNSFLLYLCACKICEYEWQCIQEEKISAMIEHLCEIMCACTCLNQSVRVSRESACWKIWYVCVRTYSLNLVQSAEVCVIKCLSEEDTVFGFVCVCVCVMV